MQLPNTPPKGTADWFPEEFKVRKYIFDTRRRVCKSYGFEEYLGPLVENADIWRAKSGEDVGGTELTRITDREGNISDLAIRPEMTPTVTRMVSRIWKECEKPVKWFSIANFYRNEKPQKGRNREFWQLNADVFGENSLYADIEVLSLTLDIMRAFNPPAGSFELRLNHRQLINIFFDTILGVEDTEKKSHLMRLFDKYEKLSRHDFDTLLGEIFEVDTEAVHQFMKAKSIEDLEIHFPILKQIDFFQDFKRIFETLQQNFGDVVKFSASLIRGFDYYDGIIFEMFDNNPDNNRSLFGGGRYNGLASIFGVKEPISAIGFAPGDETMKIFLENWGLIDKLKKQIKEKKYYFPLATQEDFSKIQRVASNLRTKKKNILLGLSPKKLSKAVQYSLKKNFTGIILLGYSRFEIENELKYYILDFFLPNNFSNNFEIKDLYLFIDFKERKIKYGTSNNDVKELFSNTYEKSSWKFKLNQN